MEIHRFETCLSLPAELGLGSDSAKSATKPQKIIPLSGVDMIEYAVSTFNRRKLLTFVFPVSALSAARSSLFSSPDPIQRFQTWTGIRYTLIRHLYVWSAIQIMNRMLHWNVKECVKI